MDTFNCNPEAKVEILTWEQFRPAEGPSFQSITPQSGFQAEKVGSYISLCWLPD